MTGTKPGQSSWADAVTRPGVAEAIVCGLAALVYAATLRFDFVYDDVLQILHSPALHEWRYLPQYFTSHVLAALYPNAGGNYYRPLLMLWLRLNYVLFGPEPIGWHATTVLCHVCATYLLFRVAWQVTGDRMSALLAGIIFGLHPVHIESVAWISGVSDPLMACFFLGSLWLFLASMESVRSSRAIWSVVLFACALLTKEPAIVLPFIIFIFVLGMDESASGDGAGSALSRVWIAVRRSAPYWFVAIIYLAVRSLALRGFSHAATLVSWSQMIVTWPAMLWFYARHLVVPVGLSEFYSFSYQDYATWIGFGLPLVLLAGIAVALWAWIQWLPSRGRAGFGFALAIIVMPLLPVLEVRGLTVGDIVHDRYLYLPSAGLAILVALSMREMTRQLPEDRRTALSAAFALGVAGIFSVLTLLQQGQWANDIALYTRGVETAPANLTVRDNLANALLVANEPDRAIPLYLEVLERNPQFWRSNYNLGYAFYKTTNYSAAENYLRRAIRVDPSDADQYIYLALAQLQQKKLPEAADSAHLAIARNPRGRGYHFVLATIMEAAGDAEAAKRELKTEIGEHPENHAATVELERLERPEPISGR
jgi:tetratricopeptide (TPR) repeat protein